MEIKEIELFLHGNTKYFNMTNADDIVYAKKQKVLRKSLDIKQTLFAELMGWKGQQECSDYENGKKHYTEKTIRKMCQILGVNVEDFTSNYEPTVKNKKKQRHKNTNTPLNNPHTSGNDELILLNCKKMLLEKELIIRELKLEISQLRSLTRTENLKGDGDKHVFVLI
ncbi:MAG: helix-turn-helix transcriptional regulator [Bacteroidia bacterium]|nr:helix-turn-helix transcriptional regulator [Bacteroidia bacterium]